MNCTIIKKIILLKFFAVAAFSDLFAEDFTHKNATFYSQSIFSVIANCYPMPEYGNLFFLNNCVKRIDNCGVLNNNRYLLTHYFDSTGLLATDTSIFTATVLRKPVELPAKNEIPLLVLKKHEQNNLLLRKNNALQNQFITLYNEYNKDLLQSINSTDYFQKLKQFISFADSGTLINNIRDLYSRNLKKPFSIKQAEVLLSAEVMPSLPDTMNSYRTKTAEGIFKANLLGIPFNAEYHYQDFSGSVIPFSSRSIYNAKFNKDAYIQNLKSYIPSFNANNLLTNSVGIWQQVKQKGELLLKKEVREIENKYGGLIDSAFTGNALENIFNKNINSFAGELINKDYVQEVTFAADMYNNLRYQQNSGVKIDTSLLSKAEKTLKRNKGLQEIIAKVAEHKKKWEQSGIAEKLKEENLLNTAKLTEIAKNPKAIAKEAEKYVNLSTLQRLFLKFNHFNIGQAGTDMSRLTFNNLVNNGISGDLLSSKNNYFSFLAGKQNDFLSLFDRRYDNPQMQSQNNAFGIRAGKGDISKAYSHLSMMYFRQSAGTGGFTIAQPGRSSIVATISNRFNLGSAGFAEVEISKSATGYQNAVDASDTSKAALSQWKQLFATENFFENLALSAKYEGEFEKYGLSTKVQVSSTAQGYENPGSVFLQRGSKEASLYVKKSLLKRKVIILLRGNYREFAFHSLQNNKWMNSSLLFDARWKLKHGNSIAVRYQPNRFVRKEISQKYISNEANRLSMDINMGTKIFKHSYRNMFTAAYLNNRFALTPASITGVRTLLIHSMQTFTLGAKQLNLNVSYNYVNNNTGFIIFNSTFNCDAGTTYMFKKKIASSSSVGYASAASWYKQLSIKQTISGQLTDRIQLSAYLDIRKNIKLYQPLLYDMTRGEVSFYYKLK